MLSAVGNVIASCLPSISAAARPLRIDVTMVEHVVISHVLPHLELMSSIFVISGRVVLYDVDFVVVLVMDDVIVDRN